MESGQINKKFIISCKYFGGFNMTVDVNTFDNKDDIINHVISMLKEFFNQHSLNCLINILDAESKNYHIHDYDFGHLFIEEGPFYICNHCHDQVSVGAIPVDATPVDATPVDATITNDTSDNINVQDQSNNNQDEENPIYNFFSRYMNDTYQQLDNTDDIDYVTNQSN